MSTNDTDFCRIRGKISNLKESFGFIMGEDRVSRFFIPSCISSDSMIPWEELAIGQTVEFFHTDHPKGPRAIEVIVYPGSNVDTDELGE